MKSKWIILIAFAFILIGVGVIKTATQNKKGITQQQTAELEEKDKRGNLKFKERVQLAKARGQQQIIIPSVTNLYPIFQSEDGLDENLSRYTVVTAQPLKKISYIDPSGAIRSWYKFRVIDFFSQTQPLQSFVSRTIPEELLPIKDNEIVVPKDGGTVKVEGIEIIQNEEGFPAFQHSQKYLLLLSFNSTTKIGELALGPQSVLPINADDTLDPSKEGHILQRALKANHSNSLEKLKADLKK